MLFNLFELDWIKKAAEAFKSTQEAIIDEREVLPPEFKGCDVDELAAAEYRIELMDSFLNKVQYEMTELKEGDFISVDADLQGEYLVICAEIHTAWDTNPHLYFEGQKPGDIGYQYYMLGNIEGRLKSGRVTIDDLEMLNAWKEELNS